MNQSKTSDSGARKNGKELYDRLLPYLFVSPFLLGVLVLYAYPMVSSFYFSLTQYDVLTKPIWIGVRNYTDLIKDGYYQQALSNTGLFVAIAVPGALIVGFLHALLLNEKLRGQKVFRGLFMLPGTIPVASSAVIWLFIWNSQDGLINNALKAMGIHGQNWLTNPDMVKWIFIAIAIWGGSGALIFLASLQGVSPELYDAAKVDGANAIQRMLNVTVPSITPAILYNLLTGLIAAFQYFAFPMLMTQGGPVGGSTFYGQYLYESAFKFFKMGYASAQAWILFIICAIVVYLIFRTSARWTYYEAE